VKLNIDRAGTLAIYCLNSFTHLMNERTSEKGCGVCTSLTKKNLEETSELVTNKLLLPELTSFALTQVREARGRGKQLSMI